MDWKHAGTVVARLIVYCGSLAFGLAAWVLVIGLLFAGCNARGDTPAAVARLRWDIETSRPAPFVVDLYRGETVDLEPRYLSYGQPLPLVSVFEVVLRYRHDGMAPGTYHIAVGEVADAHGGRIRIRWTPVLETAANAYTFTVAAKSIDGETLRAFGTIRLRGTVQGDPETIVPTVAEVFDWALISEHINTQHAPFVGPGDVLSIEQRLDGHDQDIEDLTELVGDGVQTALDALAVHVEAQDIRDDAQDVLIQQALASATMGGDITGVSTQAVVVATRGRLLPSAEDVPAHMEAIVWDAALGRYKHGSVDLSGIESAIFDLQQSAATIPYVDSEISRIEGMVDGNAHVLQIAESFASADWLEIAAGVYQHSTYGWMAHNVLISGGQILINQNGYIDFAMPDHVSRIATSPSSAIWMCVYAPTTAGPWIGYDPIRDNIPSTNQMAVRVVNTGTTVAVMHDITFYSWEFPERVGMTRDFAGLHLHVDTPDGTAEREAINVRYLRDRTASGDITGTFGTGFAVDKVRGIPVNPASLANGYGLVYYSSVGEFRMVDLATQFEMDAALASKTSQSDHNALAGRVDNVEAGDVPVGGDLMGTAAASQVVQLRGRALADSAPQDNEVYMWDSVTSRWVPRSLGDQATYATGTNTVDSMPLASVGFYRAIIDGVPTMVMVVDGDITGLMSTNGLVMPFGTIDILNDYFYANPRAYDGDAIEPAYSFAAEPGTGFYRHASGTWRFIRDGTVVFDITPQGLAMAPGRGITGVTWEHDETDPLAIHKSATYQSWQATGGTYGTNDSVIATSPLLTNGVAHVGWGIAGPMSVEVDWSADGDAWTNYVATAESGYVRLRVVNDLPVPGEPETTVSNIVARSWTRPDLVGETADTAGQVLLVDDPVQPRQAVNQQSLAAALGAVNPAAWSDYPAQSAVRLDGHKLMLGGGWTAHEADGLGYLSYADVETSTNGLVIANNGGIIMTAQGGRHGLHITGIESDGTNVTLNVSTNGVSTQPHIQWTPSLSIIDWQTLDSVSETWPSTTNGYYQIIVELPATPAWFRAVRDTGAARIDMHAPTYAEGWRVAARPHVSQVNDPTLFEPAYIGHQLVVHDAEGNNHLYQAFGTSSNDWYEIWSGGVR